MELAGLSFVLLVGIPLLVFDGQKEKFYFPQKDCASKRIELQVHNTDGSWSPHPKYPKLDTGSCLMASVPEATSWRVRCLDESVNPPNTGDWIYGVDTIVGGSGLPTCSKLFE